MVVVVVEEEGLGDDWDWDWGCSRVARYPTPTRRRRVVWPSETPRM